MAFSLFEDDSDIDDESDFVAPGVADAPAQKITTCIGHEALAGQLDDLAKNNRLPHALIFAGPEGIGKSMLAFETIRKLLPRPELIDSRSHPDLLCVEREFDEKKNRYKGSVSIDSVRRINPFMRMTPSYGGWRVAIVDDADTMTIEAQNAILKILEEPPERAILILIAHRPGLLARTIRSRCRLLQFETLTFDSFSGILRRHDGALRDSDIKTLHDLTKGAAGQALRFLEEGGLEAISSVTMLLHQWPEWSWPQIHGLADTLSRPGQEDHYKAFHNVLLWSIETIFLSLARSQPLSGALDNDFALRMEKHYGLERGLEICETLKSHFETADFSSLDKRQAVLGAFGILES